MEKKTEASWTISTVVSPGDFEYFIPIFTYSISKAYPNIDVNIFIKGLLNPDIKKYIPDNAIIHEEMFLDFPDRISTCNTLRHFIPMEYLKNYDYVYNTDIDFIVFGHKASHLRYYYKRMSETNLPYGGARGPRKYPQRPHITKYWDGPFKRIAAGCLMLSSEFYEVTKKARRKYREEIRQGLNSSCSYREYDEVIFQRICTESGLPTPTKKNCFTNGKTMNALYRDIHLGDFKFARWKNKEKMARILKYDNVVNFIKLERDVEWREIVKAMSECEMIRKYFKRLRKHIKGRKKCSM